MAGVNPRDKPINLSDVLDVSNEAASDLLAKQSEEVEKNEAAKAEPPPVRTRVEQAKEDCAVQKIQKFHDLWMTAVNAVMIFMAGILVIWVLYTVVYFYFGINDTKWLEQHPFFVSWWDKLTAFLFGAALTKSWEFVCQQHEKSLKE